MSEKLGKEEYEVEIYCRKVYGGIAVHTGIPQKDGRITHYTKNEGESIPPVETVSFEEFAAGQEVWVEKKRSRYTQEEVAQRAQSKEGSKSKYFLFDNNCQCFTNWCLSDESYSTEGQIGELALRFLLDYNCPKQADALFTISNGLFSLKKPSLESSFHAFSQKRKRASYSSTLAYFEAVFDVDRKSKKQKQQK